MIFFAILIWFGLVRLKVANMSQQIAPGGLACSCGFQTCSIIPFETNVHPFSANKLIGLLVALPFGFLDS